MNHDDFFNRTERGVMSFAYGAGCMVLLYYALILTALVIGVIWLAKTVF